MYIEILTTKKKLTKAMIKQFEPADWKYINFYFNFHSSCSEGKLFIVRSVFKFPVLIFNGSDGLWRYFPLHDYTISVKGDDVYVNNSRHLFINDKKSAELFISNIEIIKRIAVKIIIYITINNKAIKQ